MTDFGELPWAAIDPRVHRATADDVRAALAACAFDTNYLLNAEARLVETHGEWCQGWSYGLPSAPALDWATHDRLRADVVTRRDAPRAVDPARRPSFDDAVVATFMAWQGWMEAISREFMELAGPGRHPAPVERGLLEIINGVAATTRASDDWYRLAELKLRWYLEFRGVAHAEATRLVERFVEGRFESWVAPDPAQVAWVASELAGSLTAAPTTPTASVPDALQAWLGVRASTPWATLVQDYVRPASTRTDDSMAEFIEWHGRARPEWASGMRAALAACRADVAAGVPLDVATLARWNGLALGRPAQLRTTDAFAHAGRDRYGTWPELHAAFAAALAEASAPEPHVLARAARAYLDVAFFHPFVDGNARTAGLLLDAVLRRAGLELVNVGLVLPIPRTGAEPSGGVLLVRLLSHWAVGARAV